MVKCDQLTDGGEASDQAIWGSPYCAVAERRHGWVIGRYASLCRAHINSRGIHSQQVIHSSNQWRESSSNSDFFYFALSFLGDSYVVWSIFGQPVMVYCYSGQSVVVYWDSSKWDPGSSLVTLQSTNRLLVYSLCLFWAINCSPLSFWTVRQSLVCVPNVFGVAKVGRVLFVASTLVALRYMLCMSGSAMSKYAQ